jgi:hypothetical protein
MVVHGIYDGPRGWRVTEEAMGWLRRILGRMDQAATGPEVFRRAVPPAPGSSPAQRRAVTSPPSAPELPRPSRPAAVPLNERQYTTTACPYCGVALAKLPKAKTKCKSCGQAMLVRNGADQRRHIHDIPLRIRGPVPPVARRGPGGHGDGPRLNASRYRGGCLVASVGHKCQRSRSKRRVSARGYPAATIRQA